MKPHQLLVVHCLVVWLGLLCLHGFSRVHSNAHSACGSNEPVVSGPKTTVRGLVKLKGSVE
jgi:hypothetical protein